VNLVDSSAWLEYFSNGPLAGRFAAAIEDTKELLVPTIVVVEVTRRVFRRRGEDAALQAAALLHQGRVVAFDAALTLSAAELGVARKLPLADSIILATAMQFGATVWTMDPDFKGLPGVKYFAKTRGR